MTHVKKLITVFLALVMILTAFPASTLVVAADSTTITVESVNAIPGKKVDVNISIKNNPGIMGAALEISYDEGMSLVESKTGTAFDALAMTKPESYASPCKFAWDALELNDEDVKDGILLTLTFEIADDVEADSKLKIKISYSNGNIIDSSMNDVPLRINNGTVSVIDYIPGDLNGDESVNLSDVILIRRFITGYEVKVNKSAADVDGDGEITMKDVIILRRYVVDKVGYAVSLVPGGSKVHEHTMIKTSAKSVTCTNDGNIEYWYCSSCKKYFSDKDGKNTVSESDTIIKAQGHHIVVDKEIPATYDKTGLTEGSHCDICNEVIVKQNIIPKLEKSEYSITYNISNNDSYLSQQTITNDNPSQYVSEEGVVLQDLIVPGYNFKGWYTAQTGGTRVSELAKGTKGNKVFYAQWDKVEYTVTFDSPDVQVSPVTYTVDRGVTLVNPTWFGYTFVGWSLNGNIVSIIKPGTTGNITLHANWTSNRNKAKAVSELATPNIIEDMDNGQYLFVYEIGTIDNVPLSQIEYIGNSQGININKEYEYSKNVAEGYSDSIAKAISNATTKTSAWTLSEDWNKTTSATNEHDEEIGKTEGKTDSQGKVTGNKYYVSNSSGGSTSTSSSGGGSNSNSSKVTSGLSVGINGSYTNENTKTKSVNLHADASLSAGMETGVQGNVGLGDGVGIGGSQKTTIGGTISAGGSVEDVNQDKHSSTVAAQRSANIGTESLSNSESHWESSNSASSSWNTTDGYENSSSTSQNSEVSKSISQIVSDRYSYSSSDSVGGGKSSTCSTAENQELKNEYASTVEYSVDTTETVKKTISYTSDATGYYRIVMAGTVHVFAVVGYDIATNSYFTYTYNILDKNKYEYLDYSKDNANFNDCENAVLPFEIPYYVHEYISSVIARSKGLTIDTETGIVTEYNGNADNVIIPEYVSVNNGDGTYSAVRIRGIAKDVFKGNTSIKGVYLPKYIYEIPESAFEGCTSLETIIGYGVSSIKDNAFSGCKSLKKFKVDEYIKTLGKNAFDGVKEISVTAENPSVAESAINSNTKRITLDISKMTGSFDNKKIVVGDSVEYFALISNGKSYKNLSIQSDAYETFISNMTFTDNTDVPLKLSSAVVTLNRVKVEKTPGFALVLINPTTSLKLFGTIELSSKGDNAVMSKNVTLSKSNEEVAGKLKLTGNYLVNGNIINEKMLEFVSGKTIVITADEFNKYLTSSVVTFDANGGSVSLSKKSAYYGQTYGELPTPTRTNYDFDGWYTEKSGGTEITSSLIVNTIANQTFYAHWSPKKFTLTFNANGGSVSTANKTLKYGDSYGTLPTPTRDYYNFTGWYTAASGGTKITADNVPSKAENITLYAQWQQKSVSGWVKVSQAPSGAQITNRKYTYTLTSYTTSSSSSLSGWTKYNTTSAWSDYGSWSTWQDGAVSSSDSRQVETQSVVASYNYKTVYNYYYYSKAETNGNTSYTATDTYGKNKYTVKFDSALPKDGTVAGHQKYKWSNHHNTGKYMYVYADNPYTTQEVVSTNYKTQYRYRDRHLVYTYYYKKDESKESSSYPNGSNISNIQEWVQYRAK